MGIRTASQKIKDFIAFPLRAVTLFEQDRWGLSSLATERFDYVRDEVIGRCLDVGCGKYNKFVQEFLQGKGEGIDVYPYEGLSESQILLDPSHFPFNDGEFDTVVFIANLNHVPSSLRDRELKEAYRVVRHGGNIVITMGNPVAEIAVHKVVALYDRFFGTNYDLDGIRGMGKEEEYYLLDSEIISRLQLAGFADIRKKYFWTQWGLNHLLVAWKA
jgi:SAM-dependent methyltransferase